MDVIRFFVCASAVTASAFPLIVFAQPVYFGGETIVTATRIEQRLGEALRNSTVITAEDIARSGQLTLAEVLQQLGGVEMASTGGPGSPASVFMRGANAAHTLVLVDGLRLQSATVGTTAFENIPLAQIERIEIVQGPASSLYGTDAIGGVIQIFTRRDGGARAAEATVSLGSWRTRELKGSAGFSTGDTDFNLAAGVFDTDGYNITRPNISFGRFNPDDDGYRNASASAKVVHRFGGGHEVGASAFVSDGVARFDNGPGSDDRTDQRLSAYSAHIQAQLAPAWRTLLRAGTSRDQAESLDTAFPGRFVTDQAQALWQNTFSLGRAAALVAGVEYLRQEVDTTPTYDVTSRRIVSIFAALNAEHGPHAVQASVRRDDNSQFGSPTTGSIAYGYRFTPQLRARAGYGTAFHAPSFNDLYYPSFGNPALQPERSSNREAGLDWESGAHRLSATYFDNRIRDLVVFVFDPETFIGQPENLERARIRGTELGYTGTFAGTSLRARLTLQDPVAEPSGLLLQRRARQHGSLVATHDFAGWRVGAELVGASARYESSGEIPSTRMAGYAVVNLTVSRMLTPEWSVQLRWNNVADRDYELVQGFVPPPSNLLASVRWTPRP